MKYVWNKIKLNEFDFEDKVVMTGSFIASIALAVILHL